VLTAWSNDYSFETVFSRQVEAYGAAGGVILGISTSGNSTNVVEAFRVAKQMGMTTIGLTGEGGGKIAELADVLVDVPSRSTPLIQQVHICLYHHICEQVEARLAS
jgi:D-sedoheptulose 7-phosphate isomerase